MLFTTTATKKKQQQTLLHKAGEMCSLRQVLYTWILGFLLLVDDFLVRGRGCAVYDVEFCPEVVSLHQTPQWNALCKPTLQRESCPRATEGLSSISGLVIYVISHGQHDGARNYKCCKIDRLCRMGKHSGTKCLQCKICSSILALWRNAIEYYLKKKLYFTTYFLRTS